MIVAILADAGWKYISADFWDAPEGDIERVHGEHRLVVAVPAAVRRALVEHANDELPNEACGLLLLDRGTAVEYVRGRNVSASPVSLPARDRPCHVGRHQRPRPRPGRVPLARLVAAAPVTHRCREHRPLGGTAVPDLHRPHGRARRLAHRRRLDRAGRVVVKHLHAAAVRAKRGVSRKGRGDTPALAIDGYLIVNEPFMMLACGSQTNLYVPFLRVTRKVFVPVPLTLVLTLTPGPVR